MVEKIYKFPNDDGRRQRAWVTNCNERGRSACVRVLKVLEARPWIKGVVETVRYGDDDRNGTDIFMEMDEKLAEVIGMWGGGRPIPVQVKSSEYKQRKFGKGHRKNVFNVNKREHIFVFDGQDAIDVITADLAGQMVVLACLFGTTEEVLLRFMEVEMGDADIVARYTENRELLVETKWYGSLILNAALIEAKK